MKKFAKIVLIVNTAFLVFVCLVLFISFALIDDAHAIATVAMLIVVGSILWAISYLYK